MFELPEEAKKDHCFSDDVPPHMKSNIWKCYVWKCYVCRKCGIYCQVKWDHSGENIIWRYIAVPPWHISESYLCIEMIIKDIIE
jgi:Fe-S oxidoreductase